MGRHFADAVQKFRRKCGGLNRHTGHGNNNKVFAPDMLPLAVRPGMDYISAQAAGRNIDMCYIGNPTENFRN